MPDWGDPRLAARHVIAVNEKGETVEPLRWPETQDAGRFERQLDDLFAHMDAWHESRGEGAPDRPRKILIFVHGGLTPPESTLAHARDSHDDVIRAGYYPIFVVWNPELWSSWGEHVWNVRQGRYSNTSPHLGPLIVASDVGRGILRAPITWTYQLGHDVNRIASTSRAVRSDDPDDRWLKNPEFDAAVLVSGNLIERYAAPQWRDKTFPISMGGVAMDSGAPSLALLTYLLFVPTKYGLSPLLDAGGSAAWDNMYRRAMVLFDGFTASRLREEQVESVIDPGDGALVGLIEKLAQRAAVDRRGRNAELSDEEPQSAYEVTLIGHSMGSIVLNEFVRRSDDVEYKNIVYMAAACSVRDFQRTVLAYLDRHPQTRFYNLCLHPVNEIRESNAEAVAPRGSLLVWIDDMFSRPHTPLDRTLGRWQNVVEVAYAIPPHLRPRVTLKAFGVEPDDKNRPMNPQKHGHFSGQRYWLPEFWEAAPAEDTLARTEALRQQASQIERRAERRHEARQQSQRERSRPQPSPQQGE